MTNKKLRSLSAIMAVLLLFAMLPAFSGGSEVDRTAYRELNHSYDEIIADALRNRETEFIDDKYGLSMSDFSNRISYVYFTNSDIVGINDISTFYVLDTGKVVSLRVDYVDDFDAYLNCLQLVRAEVDALMPENPTEIEIVHILHDYIVSTSAFDTEAGKDNVTDYSVFYAA